MTERYAVLLIEERMTRAVVVDLWDDETPEEARKSYERETEEGVVIDADWSVTDAWERGAPCVFEDRGFRWCAVHLSSASDHPQCYEVRRVEEMLPVEAIR
jgi:hypothetical protein